MVRVRYDFINYSNYMELTIEVKYFNSLEEAREYIEEISQLVGYDNIELLDDEYYE
jgi:hypothetical protein